LNSTGHYYNTKHRSSLVRKFGTGKRLSLAELNGKTMPGPGTYSLFSEFGTTKNFEKLKISIKNPHKK
jgi:hypothetical protein